MAAALVVSVIAVGPAKAEDPYKIKKGDTLWGISGGMLKDPFQWPLIWKENARIKNPDRIYPGQRIKLPTLVSPLNEEATEKGSQTATAHLSNQTLSKVNKKGKKLLGTAITPIPEDYLFSREDMLSSGFMSKEVPGVGTVRGPVGARTLIATGDDIYLATSCLAGAGDKYLIAGVSKIDDPLTGKFSGYLIEPHGIASVTGANGGLVRATVTSTFERIGPGDILIKYVEPEEVLWDAQRKPSVEGHVLAIEKRRLLSGGMDFIYLDKGGAEGLKAGDLLQTRTGPDTNAIIQVMTVQPEFATAIIKKSNSAVKAGDIFTGLKDKNGFAGLK